MCNLRKKYLHINLYNLRSCNCGATKQMVKCNASAPLVCKAVCGKNLNCGIHTCQKLCHPNECDTCAETIDQGNYYASEITLSTL